ncbi:MAG: SDR family oxidoreductase [Nocardioides sp.]
MSTKTAFVTGAAQGIGRATAEALLSRGWRVGAYDVDTARLEEFARNNPYANRLIVAELDVTDPVGWQTALTTLCGDGGLDLLHNNAGILTPGNFEDVPLARHREILEVNVLGVVNGAHTALRYLKRNRGLMVNMCSASAIYGQPELASYSASKFAVRGLTEALELEWSQHGVGVRDLWPLFVNTAMVDGMDTSSSRSLGIKLTVDDVVDELLALIDDHEKAGPRRRAPWLRSVHRPVGRQAKVLGALAQVSPTWVNRASNKLISKL